MLSSRSSIKDEAYEELYLGLRTCTKYSSSYISVTIHSNLTSLLFRDLMSDALEQALSEGINYNLIRDKLLTERSASSN